MAATIRIIDRTEWQRLAPSFLDYNYRQVYDYGISSAERVKAESVHVEIQKRADTIGLADIRIKRIPFTKTGIAYINGGPLVRGKNGSNRQRLCESLTVLVDEFVKRRGFVLRISPIAADPEWNRQAEESFVENGFRKAPTLRKYRTILLDLDQTLECIRKQFKQKWRNCFNNSEKQNLTIVGGTTQDLMDRFSGLFEQLRSRKHFEVDQDALFFGAVQKKLDESDKLYISIAEHEGVPIAGHVSSMVGDTCVYLLGASNEKALRVKATYLLQWHTIQVAQKTGCRWYDLGGIDPERNPGVYHFKKGMGGEDVTAPGPFEYYPDGFRRMLVSGCEKVHTTLRRLRTR